MDNLLHTRQDVLALLKQNLVVAQARMKLQADQHRSNRSFAVGDWVYLRLHAYRQHSLRLKGYKILSPRFFGPFVESWGGGLQVSFTYWLSNSSSVPHFLFEAKIGYSHCSITHSSLVDFDGLLHPKPIAILQHSSKQLRTHTITEVLVKW